MEFFSRNEDPAWVECEDCHWIGQVKDCVHTYREDGTTMPDGSPTGEVEPVDECPECGSQNLLQIERDSSHLLLPIPT